MPGLTQGVVALPELGPRGHAWVTGSRARTALETALERLATEIRDGRRGWATGIRQDGMSLRLIIVGGDGWTFVMHPLMGVATLDEDPA